MQSAVGAAQASQKRISGRRVRRVSLREESVPMPLPLAVIPRRSASWSAGVVADAVQAFGEAAFVLKGIRVLR
jgi:hypothetical protein